MKSSNQIPWDFRTYMYYLIAYHSSENTAKRKKFSDKRKPEENMMLLFLLVLLSILSSSCVTRKACERRFPPTAYDSVRVVTNTVTTYRDTTIYIHLPGDTVYKSIGVNEGVSELRTPFAKSYAWVKDGRLEHRLEGQDTTINQLIKGARKRTIFNQNITKKQKFLEVNKITKWQIFQMYLGKVLLILLIIALIWVIIKSCCLLKH